MQRTAVEMVEAGTLQWESLAAMLAGRKTPLVLRHALSKLDWPVLQWGPRAGTSGGLAALRREHGRRRTSMRFAERNASRTPWEGDCTLLDDVQLGDFCGWLLGEKPGKPLESFPLERWWGYCDYQHFEELFHDVQDANRQALDLVGLGKHAGTASSAPTLWLGSSGACTPCHQDAYGCNLVAQVAGEKRWTLFPAEASRLLRAVRLPYEDSSTFTEVDPLSEGAPEGSEKLVVVLQPDDVLFVPRHWFHAVECISDWSLSVNQWFDMPEDAEERVREAVVRCLASPLLSPDTSWLNPREELFSAAENVSYLSHAIQSVGRKLSEHDVQAALVKAATRPEVVALIAAELLTSGEDEAQHGSRSRSRSPAGRRQQ
eukprot:gnl/TRDRNA2_/TRDRNA2_62408_c0_seq2.p1 gnl/TRDRNA2_/TRDRNA2_62408_c0~~gnl/TRDRNA2_/TRDRNA2_62408_c0_seq2.p1  ORF type:complete len:374 (+),score=66.23 gnl/TRDRNA2_/TRDRNA2_62408_c0_seq2:92-1213(+)